MNKHNQKTIDMFNKQDITVYLTYIKYLQILKSAKFFTLHSRSHFQHIIASWNKKINKFYNLHIAIETYTQLIILVLKGLNWIYDANLIILKAINRFTGQIIWLAPTWHRPSSWERELVLQYQCRDINWAILAQLIDLRHSKLSVPVLLMIFLWSCCL